MYGVMTVLGGLVCLLVFHRAEKRHRFPEADAELALIYAVIGALVGAKLLWLLTVMPEFLADLPCLFRDPGLFLGAYLSGGFVFYGGLLGAVFAAWLYCRLLRLPFYGLAELLMPLVPLFHAFGRAGCFLAGCCYGRPAQRFGVVFTHSDIAPNGVPLLPVQLWEAAAELALFLLLSWMDRRGFGGKAMLCTWGAAYGTLRFVLEFFRGDEVRGFLGPLSVSQVLSLLVLAGVGLLWLRDRIRRCAGQTE